MPRSSVLATPAQSLLTICLVSAALLILTIWPPYQFIQESVDVGDGFEVSFRRSWDMVFTITTVWIDVRTLDKLIRKRLQASLAPARCEVRNGIQIYSIFLFSFQPFAILAFVPSVRLKRSTPGSFKAPINSESHTFWNSEWQGAGLGSRGEGHNMWRDAVSLKTNLKCSLYIFKL